MAVLDFDASHASSNASSSLLKRVGAGVMDFFVSIGHARARTAELQYYMDMSDAQLAEKGLRRQDIAHHVLRGMLI